MERLDKFISTQTNYSGKDIKRLCKSCDIMLNGKIIKQSDVKIDPENDVVSVCG